MEQTINLINQLVSNLNQSDEAYEELKRVVFNNINDNLIEIYKYFSNNGQVLIIITELFSKQYINLNVITPIEYSYSFSAEEKISLKKEINKNLLSFDYFVKILKLNINFENYIYNSICNYLGNCMKLFVGEDNSSRFIIFIKNEFFNDNNVKNIFCGIKILDYTLTNFLLNFHDIGYFRFRKLCNSFNEFYLINIFTIIYNSLKNWISEIMVNNDNDIFKGKIWLQGLETFFKCWTFPFNISFYDFNIGNNLDDITIILYPESFKSCFADTEFMNNLFGFLLFQRYENNLSYKINYNIIKILNRIAGTRITIFENDEEILFKEIYIMNLKNLNQICFNNNNYQNKFAIEFLEILMKIVKLFGFNFIFNNQNLKQEFLQQLNIFMENLFNNISFSINNKEIIKFFELIKKIKLQKNNEEKKNIFKLTFERYLNINFNLNLNNNKNVNFFDKKYKNHFKFIKSWNKRFEYINEISVEIFEDLCPFINNYCKELYKQYYEIIEKFNNLNNENKNFILNKFSNMNCHLNLIVVYCIIKQSSYFYIHGLYRSGFHENQNLEQNIVINNSSIIIELLKMQEFREKFENYLSDEMNINFELTNLYFINSLRSLFLENLDVEYDDNNNQKYTCIDQIFEQLQNNFVFKNVNEFIYYIFKRIIKNIEVKNKILVKYILSSINELMMKLKSLKKNKGEHNNLYKELRENFFQFYIKSNLINDKKYFNIRKQYMANIANLYLNDHDEDYIENSKLIISNVINLSIEKQDDDKIIMCTKIFKDFNGLISNINISEIFGNFMRILYNKLKFILENINISYLENEEFLVSLIDLYVSILENGCKKTNINSLMNIFLKVIFDSSNILNNILVKIFNTINNNLNNNNSNAAFEFLKKNIKITKRILTLFKSILDFKDGSFSIIVYFKKEEYSLWINNGLNYILWLSKYIINFPNERLLFENILKVFILTSFDYLIDNLPIQKTKDIFDIIYQNFSNHIKNKIENKHIKILIEDDFIKDYEHIIISIGEFLINEKLIFANDPINFNKINDIIILNKINILNLIKVLFEACLFLNINNLIFDSLSKSMFLLICVIESQDTISLFTNIISELNLNINNNNDNIKMLISNLFKNIEIKYNENYCKWFSYEFKSFIKKNLKEQIIPEEYDMNKSFLSNNENQLQIMKQANDLSNSRRRYNSIDKLGNN